MIVTDLGFLRLDPEGEPLFRQIYDELRRGILSGQLPRGSRLPASRALSAQLSVSRTTVVTAFDQLLAEGYLVSRVGAGTYVTEDLPEESLLVSPQAGEPDSARPPSSDAKIRAFEPGVPAVDEFPLRTWSQIQRRQLRNCSSSYLSYGSPCGHAPLRESIAGYLRAHRGVRCHRDQVMVVSGTQQALDVVLRLLVRPGDDVYFENPGYPRARDACLAAGARLRPLAVDENGADLQRTGRLGHSPILAYVTPSHQYPLGVTLALERRMQLLEWARQTDGWIVEDDYDSEYRFAQRPIPALQGLDPADRTFYVGSLSKVLFPSLSMGYMVVPNEHTESVARTLSLVSRPPSRLDQLTLHAFMEDGHFGRHLRRMRSIYRERRATLVDAVARHLSGRLELLGDDAGLHSAARLKIRKSDRTASAELLTRGIVAPPLSAYYMDDDMQKMPRIKGLVLGFGCVSPPRIRRAVTKMVDVLG